jgi:hypothetical protein
MGGYNVVTGTFVGEAVTYTRHLSDRWSASVGEQVQFLKQLYSFDVMGTSNRTGALPGHPSIWTM